MGRGRPRIKHPDGALICSKCKQAKEYSEFNRCAGTNTGYKAYCKLCVSQYYFVNKVDYKDRYESKRDVLIAYQKQWNKSNYAWLCNLLVKNAKGRWDKVVARKKIVCTVPFRELLGCNKHELLERFRSLYAEGMHDMNYGEWEIDHIRPICSFDLTDMEQMRQCFHYTNMQPLWKEENQAKGITWSE